jgi:hypothetical protein
MEDELDDARPVAQVDENQPPVIATAVNPTGDPGSRVRAVCGELAAPDVSV